MHDTPAGPAFPVVLLLSWVVLPGGGLLLKLMLILCFVLYCVSSFIFVEAVLGVFLQ